MLIEEIIRSCANAEVAQAAVACIGPDFARKVAGAASSYGMDTGAFVVLAVTRFARHGDEGELRSVLAAMASTQEPVLSGLHRILCIMLASGLPDVETRPATRRPRMVAQLCAMESDSGRARFG